MQELNNRANVQTFSFVDKDIILYDDHRYILNVIFHAMKKGYIQNPPDLVFFDEHDDFAKIGKTKQSIIKDLNVQNIIDISEQEFYKFVEFHTGRDDGDWLRYAVELNLLRNVVVVGQHYNDNVRYLHQHKYTGSDGVEHKLFEINHLVDELKRPGALYKDSFTDPQHPERDDIRNIIHSKNVILDFDLDCFTTECMGYTFAWPEDVFVSEYVKNREVYSLMIDLMQRSKFITIAKEPACCGGLGESNKILSYLDRYFFKGTMGTFPIR